MELDERGLVVQKGSYSAEGINAISEAIAVSCSLNSIDVSYNRIDQASALKLLAAMKGKEMVSIGMAHCELGVKGAKIVAEMASVSHSLTAADLRFNELNADAKQIVHEIVEGRYGFDLRL